MMRIGIETIKQVLNKDETALWNIRQILNGGPGSGNFGHAGIPGQVGGSAPGGGGGGADELKAEPGKTYRQVAPGKNVMARGGYAMFCDDPQQISHYGGEDGDMYEFDISDATPIEDLEPDIEAAWNDEDIDRPNGPGANRDYYADMPFEDIKESFNPRRIVDSAEAYDDEALTQWLWDNVLEPNSIYAIKTTDGAIVFDEELIKKLDIKKAYK